jgi:hypothetical protein
LSFFDADGLRFHLPAYIVGSIRGHPLESSCQVGKANPLGFFHQVFRTSKFHSFVNCHAPKNLMV